MRRSLVAACVLLASACGLDVVGTGPPSSAKSPTDPTDPAHGSGTGAASPPSSDSDASVGACRDGVLVFDGTDEFVNVPHDGALDLGGDFTVEAWIKPTGVTSEMHIVSHHDTEESSGWLLRLASGRVDIVVYGSENFGDQGYSAGNKGASYVVPGKWAHVAGTLSGGTLRVYYDGVLRDSQDLGFTFGRSTFEGDVILGRSAKGDAHAYDGALDDLRLSKTARYTGPNAQKPAEPLSPDASTVALWHFDDSGNAAADASGHGHDGTLGSAPQTPKRDQAPCASDR